MPIHGYTGNIITANPTAPTVSAASGVWTTEQQLQAIAVGNWPGYEYPISRSLRFNSADSAYLQRINATTGTDPLKFTVSGWMKRGLSSAAYFPLLGSDTGTNAFDFIGFQSDNLVFRIRNSSSVDLVRVESSAVYRDFSAWYHIVAVYDSANATSTERVKLYVNGVQLTAFGTATYPSLNQAPTGTFLTNMQIGRTNTNSTNQNYGDGYLTEINFIDGQALTPSSFGLNDPETGVWSPKRYTGTYGTNGFYVNFSDNSGTTSTTLGKDSSGNGNNWTPNNFSVTAGAGNDSLVDTPTSYGTDTGAGGEVRGNYATWNATQVPLHGTLSNGNLDFAKNTSGSTGPRSTIYVSSGKWYSEIKITATGNSTGTMVGIMQQSSTNYPGFSSNSYAYNGNGQKWNNDTGASYGAAFTAGDVIGIALDLDAGTLVFYKNGVSQGTAYSSLSGEFCISASWYGSGTTMSCEANFGQRPFAYTAPSGFKALCTTNLPTPTIGATSTTQANKYFDVTLYTGNGTSQLITNSGGFQPDLFWAKRRNAVAYNALFDAVRGANSGLYSSLTNAEDNNWTGQSFGSNGFTVSAAYSGETNINTGTFAAWQWNAGGSNVTNTSGTITSTVRANTTSGFSIVTYTGTGSAATIGHGLGVAPSMIITKKRSSTSDWGVYHTSIGNTNYLLLDTTAASAASSTYWNNTSPTSSVFSIGTADPVNINTATYVAYCFAPVAGYSAFGSYTGNGSTDGPFVFCGFRPRFILVKRTDAAGYSWAMYDTARNAFNATDSNLYANLSNAESTGSANSYDLLSNGFKLRTSDAFFNANTGTYIYAAFAESPFKYSLAR